MKTQPSVPKPKGKRSNQYKHGFCKTRLYNIYCGMIGRCRNEKNPAYKYYGKRGITVCEEWQKDFVVFKDWAFANGYTDELSIDRIDVNKGYCPDNCRWVGNIEQQNNKRDNHFLECNGEIHTFSEWSRITGIRANLIYHRWAAGWKPEDILNPRLLSKREQAHRAAKSRYGEEFHTTLEIDGVTKTFEEWSEISGVPVVNIRRRIKERGWNPKEAVFTPKIKRPKKRG